MQFKNRRFQERPILSTPNVGWIVREYNVIPRKTLLQLVVCTAMRLPQRRGRERGYSNNIIVRIRVTFSPAPGLGESQQTRLSWKIMKRDERKVSPARMINRAFCVGKHSGGDRKRITIRASRREHG